VKERRGGRILRLRKGRSDKEHRRNCEEAHDDFQIISLGRIRRMEASPRALTRSSRIDFCFNPRSTNVGKILASFVIMRQVSWTLHALPYKSPTPCDPPTSCLRLYSAQSNFAGDDNSFEAIQGAFPLSGLEADMKEWTT